MSEFEFFTPRAVENEQRNRFDPELVPQTQPAAFALAFGMQIFEDCVAGFGGQRDFALDFRVDGADFIFDYVFGKLNFFDFAFFFALVVFDKDEVECPTVFLHDGVAIFEDGGVIEFFFMRQINQQYVFFSFQHLVKAFDSAVVFGFYCREGNVKVNAFGKVVVKVIIVAGVAVIYHFGIEIIVLGRAVDEDHVFLVHEVFKVVEDVFHAGGKIAKGNPVKRAGITAQKIFAHITGGGTVITDTVNDVINFGCHQRALLQKVFVFHEINDGRIVDDAADFLEERHLFEAEFQLVGFIEFAFGIKLLIPAAPFRTDAFLRVILDAGVSFNDLAFKMFEVADVIMIEADVAGFDAVRVFDADAVVAVKNADIALGAISWPKYARIARSQTLAQKESLYMRAAILSGCSTGKLILKHILPNITGPILVTAMLDIGTMMMELAGLSFLGLGAKPPVAEWGSMMSDTRNLLTTHPWVTFAPGIAIFLSVMVFNLLGDTVRDLLDPRNER